VSKLQSVQVHLQKNDHLMTRSGQNLNWSKHFIYLQPTSIL